MASKYIKNFPIPEDFSDILRDFAKEVLRNQPDDIVDFGNEYFKCLQEGLVLDYRKKGQNIPCDFRPAVPKIIKRQADENRMIASQDYEKRHKMAIDKDENAKINLKNSDQATEKSNLVILQKQAENMKKIITVEKSVTTMMMPLNEESEKIKTKMVGIITDEHNQRELEEMNNCDDLVADTEGNENLTKKVFANCFDDMEEKQMGN